MKKRSSGRALTVFTSPTCAPARQLAAQRKDAKSCIPQSMSVSLCAWPSAFPTRTREHLFNTWSRQQCTCSLNLAKRSLSAQALHPMARTQVCTVVPQRVFTARSAPQEGSLCLKLSQMCRSPRLPKARKRLCLTATCGSCSSAIQALALLASSGLRKAEHAEACCILQS